MLTLSHSCPARATRAARPAYDPSVRFPLARLLLLAWDRLPTIAFLVERDVDREITVRMTHSGAPHRHTDRAVCATSGEFSRLQASNPGKRVSCVTSETTHTHTIA